MKSTVASESAASRTNVLPISTEVSVRLRSSTSRWSRSRAADLASRERAGPDPVDGDDRRFGSREKRGGAHQER